MKLYRAASPTGVYDENVTKDFAAPVAVQPVTGPARGLGRNQAEVPLKASFYKCTGAVQQQPVLFEGPAVEEMELVSEGGFAKAAHPSALGTAISTSSHKAAGSRGRSKISLFTNHFAVGTKNPSVFHHNVDWSTAPFRKLILLCLEMDAQMRSLMPVCDIALRIHGLDYKVMTDWRLQDDGQVKLRDSTCIIFKFRSANRRDRDEFGGPSCLLPKWLFDRAFGSPLNTEPSNEF